MRADVSSELTVLRAWRDAQAPSEGREATVAGFLWALALVGDVEVAELRQRLDGPRSTEPSLTAAPAPAEAMFVPGSTVAGAWPDPSSAPPWRGLGIQRIERTREAGDGPVGRGRAFTAGPDGRPVRLAASYAEMAAETLVEARGLSDDIGATETRAPVPSNTTT